MKLVCLHAISISDPDKRLLGPEISFIRGINWCSIESPNEMPHFWSCHLLIKSKTTKMIKIHFPKITWYKCAKNSKYTKYEGKWNWFAFMQFQFQILINVYWDLKLVSLGESIISMKANETGLPSCNFDFRFW